MWKRITWKWCLAAGLLLMVAGNMLTRSSNENLAMNGEDLFAIGRLAVLFAAIAGVIALVKHFHRGGNLYDFLAER